MGKDVIGISLEDTKKIMDAIDLANQGLLSQGVTNPDDLEKRKSIVDSYISLSNSLYKKMMVVPPESRYSKLRKSMLLKLDKIAEESSNDHTTKSLCNLIRELQEEH